MTRKQAKVPEVFFSVPLSSAALAHGLARCFAAGVVKAEPADYWITFTPPGGEPFEVSLVSLMRAAKQLEQHRAERERTP